MTAPDSFVERAMELATDASVHAEARAHRFCNGSLNQLRAHLERQAARCKELEEYAERYRTLMELPGARRRVWNHVIDPHLTEGHNDIESVLDALSAPKEQST